ncbi:unnamed protein product [Effrenium voratum]|nr:unnamed protein product [Effrenium voratum]
MLGMAMLPCTPLKTRVLRPGSEASSAASSLSIASLAVANRGLARQGSAFGALGLCVGALWRPKRRAFRAAPDLLVGARNQPLTEEQRAEADALVQELSDAKAYDAEGGRVTNYGEILGPWVHFVAEGSFEARDSFGSQCPKDFAVQVERGGLVVLGLPLLSEAISGPGCVRVLYIDRDLRIFESPTDTPDRWEEQGLRVVQVREQLFR